MFPGSVRLYVNLTFIQAFPIYFTAHEPISDHFSLNRRPPDYYLALPEKPPPFGFSQFGTIAFFYAADGCGKVPNSQRIFKVFGASANL